MYGFQQAPKAWYSRLDKYLQQQGFKEINVDRNLYIKVDQGNMIILEVYVDDIIFGSDDDKMIQRFSQDMQNEFEISLLGELNFFLGLQISHLDDGIFISQSKYIKEMLKKIWMEDCKLVSTPMIIGYKLSKDYELEEVDQKLYMSMIDSLL